MCGIGGVVNLDARQAPVSPSSLRVLKHLLAHRGPDGEGAWTHPDACVGFVHRRLAVIDLDTGAQPMTDGDGNWITYNGEVYNYRELRREIGSDFRTSSDTEVVLRAYARWGRSCVDRLRGMFAFALWDERERSLFCARDRFGIKPFYYVVNGGALYFASEIKALLPFVSEIETEPEALKDYLSFQFCLGGKTLFKGVRELPPGHVLEVRDGRVDVRRYWEVFYEPDRSLSAEQAFEQTRALMEESVALHLRADVPVGAYVSGGFDSAAIASIASRSVEGLRAFTGTFPADGAEFDESGYARDLAAQDGLELDVVPIGEDDFVRSIERVIYHLDQPVAGPGSFPQYVVSGHAARHRKVLLGGQGGDEIFGGYARYLIAYFEQCIKGAIEGTMLAGNFVVTYESIIPNLSALRAYKPLLQEFWQEGLFEDLDRRYFRLVNRANHLEDEVRWDLLGDYLPFESFREIFHGSNVRKESYFDSMTHFDFKTLLPALLHVEDRVSMAHGLESRVPFLDHEIVELAARIPADVKFEGGHLKHVLRQALGDLLPASIRERTDKMGFPVPFHDWLSRPGPVRDFVIDTFSSDAAAGRELIDNRKVLEGLTGESRYGRKIWGLLSLELWQRAFHDQESAYKGLIRKEVLA